MGKSTIPQPQLDLDALLLTIKHEYAPVISNIGAEEVARHVEEDFLRAINDFVFNVAFEGSFDNQYAKFKQLPIGFQRIYSLCGLCCQVQIAGFNQYFDSPDGIYATDAYDTCMSIGATQLACIIKKAILAFERQAKSTEWIQADPKRRQSASPELDELDSEFWDCSDDIQALQISYIEANRDHFGKCRH